MLGGMMSRYGVGLAIVVCCAISAADAPAVFAKPAGPHPSRHASKNTAHRATGKPKPAVWTLSEYSKGKLHKLKAPSPYYGLLYRSGITLDSHKEVHGFKWNEERPFICETGAFSGTVKSNGVPTPEVTLETMTQGNCPERSTFHGFQMTEEFTPWSSSEVGFKLVPAHLILEGEHARLAPGSFFEVVVVDEIGTITTCRYFSLGAITGNSSPSGASQAGQSGQLSLNLGAKLERETFTSTCPEEASISLLFRSYVGQYGPAMFAEYG
jgi:hypothetical protein